MIDSALLFEIVLIVGLILLNGVFAMSEIAVVSARKTRLHQLAENGDRKAQRALKLAEHPTRFLSTVQVGITLIGVFAGAYGGASLAGQLDTYFERFPVLNPYSEGLALVIVVAAITYLSLVVGELVPKRIALNNPERVAAAIAGPMQVVAACAAPIVRLLSFSTEALLTLLGARKANDAPVTEEEVSAMLEAGTTAGVFHEEETDLVTRVFSLDDQPVSALMTPRNRIRWLDANDTQEKLRESLIEHRHSYYLVCDRSVDHVLGIVRVKDLLADVLHGRALELRGVVRKPLYVPATLTALRALQVFRESQTPIAIVIDEYGGVEGVVTLNDVLTEITGAMTSASEAQLTRRDDGSWLVDGSMTIDGFWGAMELPDRRSEARTDYHTVGGLALTELGRIPQTGDTFEVHDLKFEVVDMDGHRVDKLLVTRKDSRPTAQ